MPHRAETKKNLSDFLNGHFKARVVHIFLARQKEVFDIFSTAKDRFLPLIEVEIGRLLNKNIIEGDILLRTSAFNYYILSKDLSQEHLDKTYNYLAQIYNIGFLHDSSLKNLQIIATNFDTMIDSNIDLADIKAELIRFEDRQSNFRVIDKHSFYEHNPGELGSSETAVLKLQKLCQSYLMAHYDISPRLKKPTKETLRQSLELMIHTLAEKKEPKPDKISDRVRQSLPSSKDRAFIEEDDVLIFNASETEDTISHTTENAVDTAPAISEKTELPATELPEPVTPPKATGPMPASGTASEDNDTAMPKQPLKPSVPAQPPEEILNIEIAEQAGANLTAGYMPIWRVTPEIIDTYRLCFLEAINDQFYEIRSGSASTSLKEDIWLSRKAALDIPKLIERPKPCTVILPLRLNNILSEVNAAAIFGKLQSLTITDRRLLQIEIIDIGSYTSSDMIEKALLKARGHCKNLTVRLPLHYAGVNALKKNGVVAIGYDLSELNLESEALSPEIEKLAIKAEQLKLNSYLYGVETLAHAALSTGAGIHYISGSVLGNGEKAPGEISPFEVANLYARMLPS